MDIRQTDERKRTNGRGKFSPRAYATPLRSPSRFGKAHRLCAFTLLAVGLPLAALAEESGKPQTIILDVAAKGSLGAVCTAVILWLNNQRVQRAQQQQLQRNPPLGEKVAETYATKDDLTSCRMICRKDIEDLRVAIKDNDRQAEARSNDLREAIKENDRQAEARSKGTHQRTDAVYRESVKVNKALGMLTGILIGMGKAPAALATTQEDDPT